MSYCYNDGDVIQWSDAPDTGSVVRIWRDGELVGQYGAEDRVPQPEVFEINYQFLEGGRLVLEQPKSYSFANIQWPQFTFTPKPEPSPDAKPAVAGLMRVGGKARGFGWCDE